MREQIERQQQMMAQQQQIEQLAAQNAAQGEELKSHEDYESYLMSQIEGGKPV